MNTDITITDIRTASNLNTEEKTMVVHISDWDVPDYDHMSLDDILTGDTRPTYTTPTMDEVREERAQEQALDTLLSLIERMNTGMSMIKECDDRLAWFKDGHYVPRTVFISWVNKKNKLWAHWRTLQAEAHALNMWPAYYSLLNEDLGNAYWCTPDSEDIDNQVDLYSETTTVEQYKDAHLQEMAKYEVRVELPTRTHGHVPPCRDVTHLYTQPEMCEEAEWDSLMATCPF